MDIKNYIITESDKLFIQFGIKNVTMDDIAKQIGMSKKTIYQHFSDKNELVNIFISNKLDCQNDYFDELQAVAENAVHEIVLSVINIHAQLSSFNSRIFFDLQKYYPEALLSFSDFKKNKIAPFIKSNLERGKNEGFYRADINVDILTQLRLEQSEIIIKNIDDYTLNKYNLVEVMTEITKHYLYGICNSEGLREIEKYKKQYTENQV